ncbi:MAG: hypothetical protein SFU98_01420 [Leptospiraceae bacterium]|nr:hypothetical protein [Leptospiraceae bacterium]
MNFHQIKNIGYLLAYPTVTTEDYEKYIDCALSLLDNDYTYTSICCLASLTQPINFFEAKEIILNVKDDLKLLHLEFETAIIVFSYQLVKNISNEVDVFESLAHLKELCVSNNYDSNILCFAELYWAYQDLQYCDVQYYWEGMNKENCYEVIIQHSKKWLVENALVISLIEGK